MGNGARGSPENCGPEWLISMGLDGTAPTIAYKWCRAHSRSSPGPRWRRTSRSVRWRSRGLAATQANNHGLEDGLRRSLRASFQREIHLVQREEPSFELRLS